MKDNSLEKKDGHVNEEVQDGAGGEFAPSHRSGDCQWKDDATSLPGRRITAQTYYGWRKEFGGLKLDQAKRVKELESKNGRLKRLVAELSLEKQVLHDVAQGDF